MAAALKAISAFLRRFPWHRFAAGAIAGGGALIITLILRTLGLGLFLPEVAVDFTVGRIPGAIESFFIRTLGEGAKLLALLTAVVVFLILPGIYATLFWRVQRWLKRRWFVIAFFTLTSAGIILLGILPLIDAGFLGSKTSVGPGFASFSQVLGSWVYAAVLDYAFVEVAPRYPDGFSLSRRQFLVGSVGAIALAILAIYGFASLSMKKGRLVFASIAEMFAKEVTPTSEFYVVTKNVIDPTVDAASWRLSIGGLVTTPATYDYPQLLAKSDPTDPDNVDALATLECVSNEVGGNLISTAAIIATPADSTVVGGVVHIGGIAFAGERGISAVDVSTDGGATWKSATLSSPKSDLTWVLWTLDWTPPRSGSFRIVARAVDAAGTPQDSNPAPTFPEGSAGYDSITLLVS